MGAISGSDGNTEFGDIELALKARLFSLEDYVSVAIFANTYLPTHSGDADRDNAMLVPGAAVSGTALGAMYGLVLKAPWLIDGGRKDGVLFGMDVFCGYTVLGTLRFQLAIQYLEAVYPDGADGSAFAVTPGIDVVLLDLIEVGLATRIAVNNDARVTYLGRASLLFHAGVRF